MSLDISFHHRGDLQAKYKNFMHTTAPFVVLDIERDGGDEIVKLFFKTPQALADFLIGALAQIPPANAQDPAAEAPFEVQASAAGAGVQHG